jgi:hypothetical protein
VSGERFVFHLSGDTEIDVLIFDLEVSNWGLWGVDAAPAAGHFPSTHR